VALKNYCTRTTSRVRYVLNACQVKPFDLLSKITRLHRERVDVKIGYVNLAGLIESLRLAGIKSTTAVFGLITP
jgi:hypothetical protein